MLRVTQNYTANITKKCHIINLKWVYQLYDY